MKYLSNRFLGIIMVSATVCVGSDTSFRKQAPDGLLSDLQAIAETRMKSDPSLAGNVVLRIYPGPDGTPDIVKACQSGLQDEVLLYALGGEILQRRFRTTDTMQLSVTIPLCITSDHAIRCGAPTKNGITTPRLVVIRRIEEEDDDESGHVYFDRTYLGSTRPGGIWEFRLPSSDGYVLFRKEPDEDDYDVLPIKPANGYEYFVRQEFIDTPVFHNLSVKFLDPTYAETFISRNPLPRSRAPSEDMTDLSVKEFEDIMEEYNEDIEEEEEDFYDDYIDDPDFDIRRVIIVDSPAELD